MELELALVVGIDDGHVGTPLRGAVQDALDVARRLQARGVRVQLVTSPPLPDDVLPGVPRAHATVAGVQEALTALAGDLTPNGVSLVHVSARGRHAAAGPELILADGALPIDTLTRHFVAHPVRSVAFVIDAGFGGGEIPGERSWGPQIEGPVDLPELSDPTLLAGGLTGPVYERRIAGATRGVFTRMLTALLDDPDTRDWDLGQLMQVLRRVPGEPNLRPVLLPATDMHLALAAPAPWRGVHAVYQWQPTHGFTGVPGFGADGDWEQFDFGGGSAFPAGQFQVGTNPGGGPPQPPGPGVFTFDNQPFGAPAPNPPAVTPNDRVYAVTASWPLPGTLYAVFRDAVGGIAQSAEWYTDASGLGKLDVQPGTLTFTESSLPDAIRWQQSGPWVGVVQMPK